MKPIITALIFLLVFAIGNIYAQPSLSKMKKIIDSEESLRPKGISMKLQKSTQAGLLFKTASGLTQANILPWLDKKLMLRQNEDQLIDESRDVVTGYGYTVKKIHQYYKGIKVEHGVVNVTSKNADIRMMQMEYYSIPNGFSTTPLITEEQALEKAKSFTGAAMFAWENGANTDVEDFKKPQGELVIIQTYQQEGDVCLAYKFNIYALQPLYRAWVYVNAATGKVVLDDAIIKHSDANEDANRRYDECAATAPLNSSLSNDEKETTVEENNNVTSVNRVGTAATRTAGIREIITDSVAGGLAKPFRLHQGRNGHGIYVMNYERRPYNPVSGDNDAAAIDFTDNNNEWTAAEYNNADLDVAALDADYGLQWVSDYYYNIHNRNSFDNNGAAVWGYVHTGENTYFTNGAVNYTRWFDNAFWNGSNLHFGDGNGSTHGPRAYIDVCAHEFSHAITERTSALVYRWESGAMNEAFSDIFAACITNYAKTQDPTLTGERIWRYGEKRDMVETASSGVRDLSDPLLFNQPSTYGSTNWQPSTYYTCPVENDNTNDHCGVHSNSGVLNKWFYLITQGEVGINTKLQPYAIIGQGFDKTEKIAYMMEQNLTPNADYSVAMEVSLNIAITEYGWGSDEFENIRNAWYAVGVDSNIYNMTNTSVFTTNNFTSLATDGTYVVAGTNYSGVYLFDGDVWTKLNELTDVRINDIKMDAAGDAFIAQSGRSGQSGGGSSIAGGVNWLKYPYDEPSKLYTVDPLLHVPSRNARCIYIDPARQNEDTNSRVWVATLAYITSGNSTSGMLGQGLYGTYKEFHPVNEGINIASGTVGCATVGGIKDEVWTFVQANNGINQLLRYNAITSALIGTYDHNSHPTIPSGFNARAIYGDAKNRLWVGLATGGVLVLDEHKDWHVINFPQVFPPGTAVNYNAITGDAYGDVYIGTTSGIVFFDHGIGQLNRLDDTTYYRLYTKKNGLPSSNINALAFNSTRFKLYVATDSGIVFWNPLCLGNSCNLHRFYDDKYAESQGNGNWSDPSIWSTDLVPDSATIVVVTDTVTVDIQAQCQSLSVGVNGNIRVNTGQGIKIFDTKQPIIDDEQRLRSRQR